MTIYNFSGNEIKELEMTSFTDEGILERKHLQYAIKNNIEVIASNCLVIAEEFSEWDSSKRRIDLLAIDKKANIVVIELKRTDTGEFMELQAIRYASMVSTLTYKRVIEIYKKYLSTSEKNENAESKILEFLEWDEPQEDNFGEDTRIILVSANFSKELTTSVMWLNERSINIKCIRLIPYKFNDSILIDAQQVIPLPEAESYQVKLRQKSAEKRDAISGNRDYTKYIFDGLKYNKRKLVQAVVSKWISVNKPTSIEVLRVAFPEAIRKNG